MYIGGKFSERHEHLEQRIEHILVIRTDRIGDVILTLPMARVIRRRFPTARIAMLIRRYTTELVDGNADVDHVIFYDDGKQPLPFFQLITTLRAQKFDVAIHTHPRFHLALLTWVAGIPIRVGTGYRWYSWLFNRKVYEHRKDAKRHELEYNINLLEAIGCSADGCDIQPRMDVPVEAVAKVNGMLSELGVGLDEKFVILHPGSGGSARDWSPAKFGELGQRLVRDLGVRVIVTGGSFENDLVQAVRFAVGEGTPALVDRFNLKELGALAMRASAFVANSTGPIHIAAAVGTPVVGMYPQVTPLSAARWGPYTNRKVICSPQNKPIDCTDCVSSSDAICTCMDSISVDEVYDAVRRYLVTDEVSAI